MGKLRTHFTKLDGRYTGYPVFKYSMEILGPYDVKRFERIEMFNEMRDWCEETWGKSIERDDYLLLIDFPTKMQLNPAWCWHNRDYQLKIFLRDKEERTWAELRWK